MRGRGGPHSLSCAGKQRGAWPGPPHGARNPAPLGSPRWSVSPGGKCSPAPTKATAAAHRLCPRANGTSGPLHLHPRSRGSRNGLPAAWAQRRTALQRKSECALHSVLRPAFDSARHTPAHGRFSSGCREAWVLRQPRGGKDGPAGRVLPTAPRPLSPLLQGLRHAAERACCLAGFLRSSA